MVLPTELLTEIGELCSAGRFPEAEKTCRCLLDVQPQRLDALNLLGEILLRQGKVTEAIEVVQHATTVHPDNVILCRNLGVIHWTAGNKQRAIDAFRRAIELDPRDAETLINLGAALMQMREWEEAVGLLRTAVREQPKFAHARMNLAELYSLQGNWGEAGEQYEEAVRLSPHNAQARFGLGVVQLVQNDFDSAVNSLALALQLKKDFAEAESFQAIALQHVGRAEEADALTRSVSRRQKNVTVQHVKLGNVLNRQGRIASAVVQYEHALRINPDLADAHNSLGSAFIDLGRFPEAVRHLEAALRLRPSYAAAYFNLRDLALQGRYSFSEEQLNRLEKLVRTQDVSPQDASTLHFTLAGVRDRQGQYEKAFAAFRQANEIMHELVQAETGGFDIERHRATIDAIIHMFAADYFQKWGGVGLSTDVPVFVVGMPRSGTTLVEQIIASHPDADGLGELPDIARLANELGPTEMGKGAAGIVPYPYCMQHGEASVFAKLAGDYLHRITACGDGAQRIVENTARRIVDKMWQNYLFVGFIATLFPHARIVHCRRDALDVCLACYLCRLEDMNWSWRLEDIGAYFREYDRVMAHWGEVLPTDMYEVSYEKLVEEPERIGRELIEYCGLDWNPKCLEFHKSDRAVQTASRVQVRRPIFKTSMGRWKNYEKHLLPLRQALGQT